MKILIDGIIFFLNVMILFFFNLVLLMFFCEFLVGSIYSNNIILLMLFYEKMLILDIEIVCFIEVVRRYVDFFSIE